MPSSPEIESYSAEADRFIAELDEEYYLHYAGLKDKLELEDIYDRHAKLTQLENVQSVGAAGVDELSQPPHTPIIVAQRRTPTHARGVRIPEDRPMVPRQANSPISTS